MEAADISGKGADGEVSHCMLPDPWVWRIANETFSQSRPEDADISVKGAGDGISDVSSFSSIF